MTSRARQVLRDALGHRPDRVVHPGLARLVQRRLHFLHEGVEMHPAFPRGGGVMKEQVHQHRLATTHSAPEVEALLASGRLRLEQPRQQASGRFRPLLQPDPQLLQPQQRRPLRRVGAQQALGHAGVVDRLQVLSHGVPAYSHSRAGLSRSSDCHHQP